MKPLVTKEYIFKRKLDGKPIVVDMMTLAQRMRLTATRELFHETGIFKRLPEPHNHGRNTVVTHEIHYIVPCEGNPYLSVIDKGVEFLEESFGKGADRFLP